MLSEKEVKKMALYFFHGEPEISYAMCSDLNEWEQFIQSIKKEENHILAYNIMARSNLSTFNAIPGAPYKKYPTFDIGY